MTEQLGSAIEEALEHYEFCFPRVADSRQEHDAFASIAVAARAELRALLDAVIVAIYEISQPPGIDLSYYYEGEASAPSSWVLRDLNADRDIASGPIVNGLPVLTDAARRALEQP